MGADNSPASTAHVGVRAKVACATLVLGKGKQPGTSRRGKVIEGATYLGKGGQEGAMSGYCLTIYRNGRELGRCKVGSKRLLIGRSSKADVLLPDESVSREHACVHMVDDRLFVTDNHSTNGVVVNGETVSSACLVEGDVVSVGVYRLVAESMLDEANAEVLTAPDIVGKEYERGTAPPARTTDAASWQALQRLAVLLTKGLGFEELLSQVLSFAMATTPARRGLVVTCDETCTRHEIVASQSSDGPNATAPYSKTIVDHVFRTRRAVLAKDAQEDPRFRESDSVFRHGLHALMCAPLCGSERVVGVLYLDGGPDASVFSGEHLHWLTTVGRLVGAAVENLLLERESIERERVAAVGEVMAGINHQVKNILCGVKTGMEFIDVARDRSDAQKMEFACKTIGRSLAQFEELTTNLLIYARKVDMERRPASLNEIVAGAIEQVRPHADRRGTQLVFRQDALDPLCLDASQVCRAIRNLLVHGIDACERGDGTVEVSTWQDIAGAYLQVSDTGGGIPPEEVARIPDMFVSAKGMRHGGLELACSYRVVEQHGGRVSVQSEPGKGTVFTVFLPRDTESFHPIPVALGKE